MLFFLAGLTFFIFAELGIDWKSEAHRLLTQAGIKHAWVEKLVPAQEVKKEESVPLKESAPPASTPLTETPETNPEVAEAEKNSTENKKSLAGSEDEAPTDETVESSAPAKEEGNYRIQLYSLKEGSKAKEEVTKLREEGFDGYWKKAVTQNQNWYMVYVGPYKEAQPARIHVNALKFSGRNPILLSVANSR